MKNLTLTDPAFVGAAGGFSPLSLSPALWLDASDAATITSSGSPAKVSQWNDKSGNGRNVSNGLSTQQPGTGTTTQNGLNVLTFDGGDFLSSGISTPWNFMTDGSTHVVAMVLKANTTGANLIALSTQNTASSAGWRWGHLSSNVYQHFIRRLVAPETVVANDLSPSGTGTYILSLLSDASNVVAADRSAYQINNGSLIKNNTATSSPTTAGGTLIVGARGGTLPWNGWIAEVIVVPTANATEANRVALRDYLNAKWAVY